PRPVKNVREALAGTSVPPAIRQDSQECAEIEGSMYFARACAQVVQLRRGLATSEDYERLSHSHVLALPLHDFTLRPLIAAVRISLAETTTRSSPPLQPSARTLPRARLPVASRRVRACARREASCHFDRCLPQPGVQLRFCRRRAVPSRDYLCP